MQAGMVIGTTTSTVKHPSLEGWKLLVVQPLAADGCSPDGEPVLSIDPLGAGVGCKVIITSDGKSTRLLVKNDQSPVRWHVVGMIDS